MTERRANPTLRIPIALIGPIYGLIAGVAGFYISWTNANTDIQKNIVGMKSTMASQSRALVRVEEKVDGSFSATDAAAQFDRVYNTLKDHETRVRVLEAPKR